MRTEDDKKTPKGIGVKGGTMGNMMENYDSRPQEHLRLRGTEADDATSIVKAGN